MKPITVAGHKLSSSAKTLGLLIRIPLKEWMFFCVYSVAPTAGWSPTRGVLETVDVIKTFQNRGEGSSWTLAPTDSYFYQRRNLLRAVNLCYFLNNETIVCVTRSNPSPFLFVSSTNRTQHYTDTAFRAESPQKKSTSTHICVAVSCVGNSPVTVQLMKELPGFFEIRRSIVMSSSDQHWYMSRVDTPASHYLKIHFNVNFRLWLRLKKW